MKVSRCGCLLPLGLLPLGLLVVVEGLEGIKDVPLSSGKIYYSIKCPADWTKLWLREKSEEVKSFASDERQILLDVKYAEAGKEDRVTKVSSYGSDDLRFYKDDRLTVIYFDSQDKEMMLHTTVCMCLT
eukprot:GHVS01023632.1.p1 GENE.GHVS01023632.1~~GHVS01023632.1.p1  ORF type:complete len:129 (+),score=7.30 GHVS01023632.1:99-485(+)